METKTERRVTVIPGDGIGKEVMEQALLVIQKIGVSLRPLHPNTRSPSWGKCLGRFGRALTRGYS